VASHWRLRTLEAAQVGPRTSFLLGGLAAILCRPGSFRGTVPHAPLQSSFWSELGLDLLAELLCSSISMPLYLFELKLNSAAVAVPGESEKDGPSRAGSIPLFRAFGAD
jgi:hypothetical protein